MSLFITVTSSTTTIDRSEDVTFVTFLQSLFRQIVSASSIYWTVTLSVPKPIWTIGGRFLGFSKLPRLFSKLLPPSRLNGQQ